MTIREITRVLEEIKNKICSSKYVTPQSEALDVTIELLKHDTQRHRVTYNKGYKKGNNDALNQIRAEIEKQEKWLMSAGYTAYNVDIAFSSIKLVLNKDATRKKGKWTPGDPICPCCGEDKFKDLDVDIWSVWRPKYCPNCGTKMKKRGIKNDK